MLNTITTSANVFARKRNGATAIIAILNITCILRISQAQMTIGSPCVQRSLNDGAIGAVFVYRGPTSPWPVGGTLASWRFFDSDGAGRVVTPLLFEVIGAGQYRVAAIGTTRTSNGSGLQEFPFAPIAGQSMVTGGAFTFGFTDRAYTVQGNDPVAGTANGGVVNFSGFQIFSDLWSYTHQPGIPIDVAIGTLIGVGGYSA